MTGVVFEKPPPGHRWRSRLEPLLERPCEWARVGEYRSENSARSAASLLRNGAYELPPGRFEFTSRGVHVYAQFLGPEEVAA